MNGIHPKLNRGASCLLAAVVFATGCQSTSSGINNPFLAPDRVAPPSTRVLAPGQAQPYYQGDPLPVMQSGAGTAAGGPLTANVTARSSSGGTLAWNAPASGASSSAAVTNTPPPWGVAPQASTPIARVSEGAVSVPTDSDSLRFALPASASTPSLPAVAVSPSNPPVLQPSVPAQNQGVSPASYNAPATNGLAPVGTTPVLSPTPQPNSVWQTPQVGSTTAPITGYGQAPTGNPQPYTAPQSPGYTYAQSPQALPTNPMAVELRSVPSPAQPGDPMPRIRVPGYDAPETALNDNFHARTSMR